MAPPYDVNNDDGDGIFAQENRVDRKDNYPILTVSDMVLMFSNVLPSRMNNVQQVIEIIEQRHQKDDETPS